MFRSTGSGRRLIKLTKAFNNENFEITRVVTYGGRLGLIAESTSAVNYDTGKPKKVYYLEGNAYETGFLMGSLAAEEIERMTCEFADRIVFAFIGCKQLEKIKLLQEALIRLVYELSKNAYKQLPLVLQDEIRGILDGCRGRGRTKVNMEHLIALNTGIDTVCSMIYSGSFKRTMPEISPEDFRLPLMCNAFSLSGNAAGNGYYFGRDFMFPSADIFQDMAAMVIYNPVGAEDWQSRGAGWAEPGSGSAGKAVLGGSAGKAEAGGSAGKTEAGGSRQPMLHVSVTAPGMVGSIAAMNISGVALGVDMSPGANCDPQHIGTNSLLLARLCAQFCRSASETVDFMKETPRGVAWNYIVADGTSERSCVVEAGASGASPDFTLFPPAEYKDVLPDAGFIRQNGSVPFQNGLMARWNDYRYPEAYLAYNEKLWSFFNEQHKTNKQMFADAFSQNGFINRSGDKNCPSSYYFAPQREENDEILIATNHYIIPEMRYFTMHHWTQAIVGDKVNDIQWRYDELNEQINARLSEKGSIDFEDAKELTDFLSPLRRYPDYYAGNPRSRDGKEIRIEGCTSVFDLKNKVVESHYGYYCDKWVRLTLPKYL